MSINPAITRLLELRRHAVLPVAQAYHQDVAPDSAYASPPTILLLGNHSSGKSSLINHLLGKSIQRTGIAPTDDGFTMLFHGEYEETIDGKSLTSNRALPLSELSRFGPGLIEHLRGRALPADLLKHVRLIDSPGMIDGSTSEAERPYDFPAVVRWFAQQADLVLLFFDPEKPGTTGETITILTESLSGIDNKLRIVMNKMDLFEGMRDFARTYGALCWNLSRSLPTKDLPHIYTTVIPALARPNPRLPLDGFQAALRELEGYVAELPQRRSDTVISRAIDEARQLHLRAIVTEHFRALVRRRWRLTLLSSILLAAILAAVAVIGSNQGMDLLGLSGLVAGAVLALFGGWWLSGVVARSSEARGIHRLDEYFHHTHLLHFARSGRAEDLRHDWTTVRPVMQRVLGQIGLRGLKRVRQGQIHALQRLWEQELPALRRR
ncbi:MAG: GTPase [Planctomycetota bacterium]|nr:MAG: GTPase [Planctomycetota bacterium]